MRKQKMRYSTLAASVSSLIEVEEILVAIGARNHSRQTLTTLRNTSRNQFRRISAVKVEEWSLQRDLMETSGMNCCNLCFEMCDGSNNEWSRISWSIARVRSGGYAYKGTDSHLWQFQLGKPSRVGRDRFQGTRIAAVTTQVNKKASVVA